MYHHAGKNKNLERNLFLIGSIFRIALILTKSSESKQTVVEFVGNTNSGYAINWLNIRIPIPFEEG